MADDTVTVWGGVPRIGRAPANNELLVGNGSGFTLQTVAITLDNILGSTQGSIAYRSASQWTQLVPGTANNVLQTNGASSNPSWVTPETVVNNALGGSNGALAYKVSGDWSALAIGASTSILSSNGSVPTWASVSALFDAYFSAAGVGSLIARDRNPPDGSGLWSPLNIGASYTLLSSIPGTGGNLPLWTTLTNVIDNGTSGGSVSIGQLIFRSSSDYARLNIGAANTILSVVNPGGGNVPAWQTPSQLFDSYFSASIGALLTRDRNAPNGSGLWGALSIGATNTILASSSGTGGNLPAWTTISNAISNGTAGTTFQGDMLYFGATALEKLGIGAGNTLLTSNGTIPVWSSPSSLFDSYFSSSVGALLTRDRNSPNGSGLWGALSIGATNTILASGAGTGGNLPTWATITDVISSGTAGATNQGDMLYFGTTALEKLKIGAGNTLLTSNGTIPVWSSPSSLFDSYFSNSRQAIISRLSGGWGTITPSASPYLIFTNNTGNTNSDLGWTTISSAISNGTAGTTFQGDMLYFGATALEKLGIGANGTILTSSGGTTPAWSTVSSALDTGIGNTVGGLLYRSSSGSWANSGTGTSGYVLTTQGAGANPTWGNAWQTVYRTTSQNITSTSFVDDNQLSVSVVNGDDLLVEGFILYLADTGGSKLAVNGPASSLQFQISGVYLSATAVNTSFATTAPASLSVQGISFYGVFSANATGTFVLRHSLNTASGTTTIQAGSWIKYYKV